MPSCRAHAGNGNARYHLLQELQSPAWCARSPWLWLYRLVDAPQAPVDSDAPLGILSITEHGDGSTASQWRQHMTPDLQDEAHLIQYWRSPTGDVETQTVYSRAWGDAIRAAIPQSGRTWDRHRQVWCFDAPYAETALELAAAFFTERIALDTPPTRARRPMTQHRAYATLHLLPSAPLAVAEASYAALCASGRTTEQQRALDEAIALIRHIQASDETPSLDTS